MLRQAISRINIHRGKKLNAIAKKKDDICKHLESGNEMNAKVWVTKIIPYSLCLNRLKHYLMKSRCFQYMTLLQSCAIS